MGRRMPAVGSLLLAAVAYVPLLLTAPGEVGADTKTYLYLDPGRLLGRAVSMWDTNIGLGTVTHQNIGYLWPMGPWYWFFDTVGVPDWLAQRLWLGTIIFAAGMGVRFMLKELRWLGPGLTVASFAYALSPYLLHYGARISVILLPFAGLPWLIGIAARSVRRGGWRWPAVFALVTLTVGGVNATSLILVMAGPILWMLHAAFVSREASFRTVVSAGLRITVLTAITSLWWIAGLAVQGAFGIPILRYTETYYTVANAALSTELLRGLGYWFFYGRDALGAWIAPAERLVQSTWALVLSFTLPLLALVSGFLTRFANRGYFALLVASGVVIGVGAHPWEASAPVGATFQAWTETDSGLAFRSTPRAVPLIALGLAVLLAAGLAALAARWPGWRLPLSAALLVLICANQWALFAGEMVDRNLKRDEELPEYWLEAAEALDAAGGGSARAATRVYELPGVDFASYRWGNTVDPITPGLIDRPYVARELIPYGTAPSADLINAWDLPIQEGSHDPAALTPIAQLMGVGTIAHRGDLQYERFRTPRPDTTYEMLTRAPGLVQVAAFAEGIDNEAAPELPLDDEVRLGEPVGLSDAPAVSLFDLEDPRAIARTVSADTPTLLAGDGAGIVAWARTGGLDPDRAILYPASFVDEPDRLRELVGAEGTQLVVTDTNRRQGRRWGSVRENDGYTERAGEEPLDPDPADNRLEKFPGAGDDSFTVTEQRGGATLSASAYGNPVSYTPADRAARAMDGNPSTAWRVGAFDEPRGEFLQVELDDPMTASELTILQRQPPANRWITEVELSFDGGEPEAVGLDESSLSEPGQTVEFGERAFETLRITITETNIGVLDRYIGISDVGIAELRIPGAGPVTEVVRPPTDLLAAAGSGSIDHPVSYVFTRRSSNPAEVVTSDEEDTMLRLLQAPVDRGYTVFGSSRVAADASEALIDSTIGMAGSEAGAVTATSSHRLAGDPRSRAASALDGDPTTAWQTPVNGAVGSAIEVDSATPFDLEDLEILVRNDGLHSLPSALFVSVDGGEAELVELATPAVADRTVAEYGATESITVPFRASDVNELRIEVAAVAEATSLDWFSGDPTQLPVAVAELGLSAQVAVPDDPTPLPAECRGDLLSIDGDPVPVRIVGTVGDYLDGDLMELTGCEEVGIVAGETLLASNPGTGTGFEIEQVVLASAPGGDPGRNTLAEGPEPVASPPTTTASNPSRLSWDYSVEGAEEPYWVVLGQSFSPGFTATTHDGTDLGEPTLVNGYANGWLVDPEVVGPDADITVTWTPQRLVWIGIVLSVAGLIACVVLLVWNPRPPASRSGGVPDEYPHQPMRPALTPLLGIRGTTLPAATAIGWAALSGALAFLLFGWAVAGVVAVVVAVALSLPRGQVLMRILGIAAFASAAGFVVLKQWRNDYLVDFNWMNQFETTHGWTLAAVALLLADPMVSRLRDRARRASGGDPETDSADGLSADGE